MGGKSSENLSQRFKKKDSVERLDSVQSGLSDYTKHDKLSPRQQGIENQSQNIKSLVFTSMVDEHSEIDEEANLSNYGKRLGVPSDCSNNGRQMSQNTISANKSESIELVNSSYQSSTILI